MLGHLVTHIKALVAVMGHGHVLAEWDCHRDDLHCTGPRTRTIS